MKTSLSAPSSTYRLQLNGGFTFDHAREIVDYLSDLGIGACYISPILKARPGSVHGYDVIDHSVLNPEIGSPESLRRYAERLREFDMGLILDIVPNHMCVADLSNAQWFDVLENGPSSLQARFFDIDWNPPREDLANKVLLPILGDQYGRVLENQQIRLEYEADSFLARYYDKALPIAPRSWPRILGLVLQDIRARFGDSNDQVLELESIVTALGYLPVRTEKDPERIRERLREKEIIRRRLSVLVSQSDLIASGIATALRALNGIEGNPSSFADLEQLLSEQAYRLSSWRVAADEINYRRFFDINELAAIRTEDPTVFEDTHKLIFDFIQRGWITGLRVDHPDGLFDPARYFDDLQVACRPKDNPSAGPFFVVAEKILAANEELRMNWAVDGTVGYGFLNRLNGLFVYPGSKKTFAGLYSRWTGWSTPFEELVYASKKLILGISMSSELNVLARRLDRICQQHRHTRDFTLESLVFALREVIACFPVYRTYIDEQQLAPDAEDRRHIETAIEGAKTRNPAIDESVFDAIGSLLLLHHPDPVTDDQRAERRLFVMRFQQLTGPVMAKGVEDTAFYRYYPLASLNEVGGDPDEFGTTPRTFHKRNLIRLQRWPRSLLATSTHDTKRSEDVRARINVLSDIPVKWYEAVRRWSELNRGSKKTVGGIEAPDRNAEYLLYQTLVGAWPFTNPEGAAHGEFVRRIHDYIEKALKEAKLHTSWINPNRGYDRAVRDFICSILEPRENNGFLRHFRTFLEPVAKAGIYNSLSQVLLKIASPGIPDFYQGAESWDLSLVDPDNRRPVNFQKNRTDLASLRELEKQSRSNLVEELMRTPEDGRIKLYLTSRALRYRRANQELFGSGSYHPVEAIGACSQNAVSFARKHSSKVVVAVAGRFFLRLKTGKNDRPAGREVWGGTVLRLPKAAQATEYVDILTGNVVRPERRQSNAVLPLGEVFASLPIALLESHG